jgi:hypothetical protein
MSGIHHQEYPAWRTDVDTFAGWFSEKGTQVELDSLVAFGIPISSRYGKVWELMEMLAFTQVAASTGVAGYITNVYYDSKACICTVSLKEEVRHQPDVQTIIDWCGDHTLSLFMDDENMTLRGRNCQDDNDDGSTVLVVDD